MKIEVLYFRNCPSPEPLRGMISEVLLEEGLEATVEFREVHTEMEAKELRFPGSPTILINGMDFEDKERTEADYGLKCRVYDNNGILMSWPSKDDLRQALLLASDEELYKELSGNRIGRCC